MPTDVFSWFLPSEGWASGGMIISHCFDENSLFMCVLRAYIHISCSFLKK